MAHDGEPVAPEFKAFRRDRPVTISYDSARPAVVVSDDRGRNVGTTILTKRSQLLELDADGFHCDNQSYSVPDDEYGMALAFVHFVNQRIPRDALTHVQTGSGVDALTESLGGSGPKFQYAVVNVGILNSPERMAGVLATAGQNGWELVTVYDKASNWLGGMEKGFMLLKRQVPTGAKVSQWCVVVRN